MGIILCLFFSVLFFSCNTERVRNVFGNNTLEYTVNLCQRHYDFLVRMPENIIIHILLFLDADDLQQLSKTCKKFQQVRSDIGARVQVRC